MTQAEILHLNREMALAEISAQHAKTRLEKLKYMWRALKCRKELELYV